jgi:DNA-binding CsgD family transcriptional regulator
LAGRTERGSDESTGSGEAVPASGLPLTGRRAQLDWTEARLDAGGSVLVMGEPGIGKTRLMAEALDRAAARGRAVGRVAVAGSSISLPLAPLAHLLPPDIDPSDEFAALQSALDALRAAGGARPLLVGVDDAHLLDDLSTLVLHQAVVANAAQVVATARAEHGLPDGIEGIWRSERGARLDLMPLDPHAVGELVEVVLGGAADGATRSLIAEAAAGSPLAVIELLNHGRNTGRLHQRGGLWSWSGGIGSNLRLTELLGLFLDDLAPASRELLELVALGEPLPVEVVEALAPAEVVADVERRGYLVGGVRPGTVRPSHPLIAEQLVGDLGVLRRRQLLTRLVTAFEPIDPPRTVDGVRSPTAGTLRPSLLDDDRIRVALWSLECGREIAVPDLLHAAQGARDRQAHAESEQLARVAFERAPDFASGLLLGRTLHGLGRFEEADATFATIADLAASDEELADYVLYRSLTLGHGLDRDDDASELVEQARHRFADADLAWSLVQIEARRHFHRGDINRVLALWDEAATAPAPESARYELAEWASGAYSLMGRTTDGAALMGWVAEASGRHGADHPRVALLTQFYWAMGIAAAGDIASVAPIAEPFYEGAVRDGNDAVRAYGAMVLQFIATFRADLVTAERLAREATFVPPTSQPVRMSALCLLARILALQGRPDEAAAILDDVEPEERASNKTHRFVKQTATALVAAQRGRQREAVSLLRSTIHDASAAGQNLAAVQAAFDLVCLGHPSECVAPLRDLSAVTEGPFVRCVAALADAAVARDVEGLETVAEEAAALELRLVALAALSDAAAAARDVGRTSVAAKVLARLDVLAAECPGFVRHGERVELGLTARELEVARLAAQQLTDKAIAEQLFLSVRTVNAHLRSIYTKLGIASRAELRDVPGL